MPNRLTLIAHAATTGTRRSAFPTDEPLDAIGVAACARAPRPGRVGQVSCSPEPASVETAERLGFAPTVVPELRGWDLGRWAGLTLDEVVEAEPAAVAGWMADPTAAPHDGEPLTDFLARIAVWLDACPADGHHLAVVPTGVARAAVIHALDAPAAGFWRVDLPPLGAVALTGRPATTPTLWTLHRLDPAPT